jgi:geranylgeranyl pyrophosphate synthase
MLRQIHDRKTAAMIWTPLVMGGLIGGAPAAEIKTLRSAGQHLGMAFQIVDDILDTTGDAATLGKTPGKDAKSGKTTFVGLYGLARSRQLVEEESAAAVEAFRSLPGNTEFLVALTQAFAKRSK